ncbi:MAG: gliding motility-associated C-terminal domain-containing protein [Bacteroidales bacterium]|nr:gliding motility-associated C-terminal domain-containing protein [Bacteroidales bacterium]
MENFIKAITLIILYTGTGVLAAQDTERPLPPILDLVTVDPFSGHTDLEWTAGGSPDVAGYVIYLYIEEEGYAIDTIFQPYASSYTNTDSNAEFYSESYVIAAIDSSENISPLSNFLNTIFIRGELDTCAHRIELIWNTYKSEDPEVSEYRIYSSFEGNDYVFTGSTPVNDTAFSIESFESYSEYCFYVEARLSNGSSSFSNIFCINTNLPIPPSWINADYASINDDGSVQLSFTIDPLSEYTRYRIERSNDTLSGFVHVIDKYGDDLRIEYTDYMKPDDVAYYRLAALNSCDEPVVYSNLASTINLNLTMDTDLIRLQWNGYYQWRGGVSVYRISRNISGFFEEIATVNGNDTTFTDDIKTFLYETGQGNICYRVIAEEGYNPYYYNAISASDTKCIEQPVKIYVPNAFTPDNNSLNDIFRPVLSFTPVMYKMIITNRAGITLFKTTDYLEGWDGRHENVKLPEDVYIWLIEVETPEGKIITKTGTVTIIFNLDTP